MLNKIIMKVYTDEDDEQYAYVYLPNFPDIDKAAGCSKKTVQLIELMPDYKGPDIIFDFNEDNEIIGIEILT